MFVLMVLIQTLFINTTLASEKYKNNLNKGQTVLFNEWLKASSEQDMAKLKSLIYPKSLQCLKVKQNFVDESSLSHYYFDIVFSIRLLNVIPYEKPENPPIYNLSYFEVMPTHTVEVSSMRTEREKNGKVISYTGKYQEKFMIKSGVKWFFVAHCSTELGLKFEKGENEGK